MATRRETERIAKSIVLAQGNVFIKELLRQHGIKIGSTKADFETNLIAAIRNGDLAHEHIETWLRENEGWGNQTIYPYKLSQKSAGELKNLTEVKIKKLLDKGGIDIKPLWNADASLEFPDTPTLTGVYYEAHSRLQFVWHKGSDTWQRSPSKDYEEDIDGDRYQFKASRQLSKRSIVRCEIRPRQKLAVVFVQLPGEEDHRPVLNLVAQTVESIVDLSNPKRYNMPQAILDLDGKALATQGRQTAVRSKRLELMAGGAGVNFLSAASGAYQDVPAVRRVRNAVVANDFAGERGDFIFPLNEGDDKIRDLSVKLHGEKYCAYVRSQLTRDQVWDVISTMCGA